MSARFSSAVVALRLCLVPLLCVSVGAAAQSGSARRGVQPGRVATSTVGEAGRRIEGDDPNAAAVRPMARIQNRISNRIQSRIANRIDRDYDPQATAISPFQTAQDRVRASGRTRR